MHTSSVYENVQQLFLGFGFQRLYRLQSPFQHVREAGRVFVG